MLVLSHEAGVAKPDRRIYEMALERIGSPAEKCVFIDDQEEALKPTEELGMKTILFKSVDQLKDELKSIGVSVE